MPSEAEEMIAAGEPAQALALLQSQVKKKPGDVKLRIFLFQLLCVLGQWPRAATQLEVCGELDAGTLAMVNTYREALKCELVRESVFAGTTTPLLLGQPQEWVARLVEAMQVAARGDAAAAARLRAQALEMAPAQGGTLDGEPFDWIADADSRLGPVLEVIVNGRYAWIPFAGIGKLTVDKPEDLRDFVWAPAHLEFPNGGDTVALVPTRYPVGRRCRQRRAARPQHRLGSPGRRAVRRPRPARVRHVGQRDRPARGARAGHGCCRRTDR